MLTPHDHNTSNDIDTISDDQSDDNDEDSQWLFNIAGIQRP